MRGKIQWFFSLCILLSIFLTLPAHGEPDYNKIPIFFVHGYGMKSKCWKPMISFLMKNGYPREYLKAIQLTPSNGSNIKAAEEQIAPAIEKFLESINKFVKKKSFNIPLKTKIDLISHSMGGLSSRWYTSKIRPNRVSKWISLAGANHGTNDVCPPKFVSPGADDLCPAYAKSAQESFVQYFLNGAPKLADVDETTYGIGKDSCGVDSIPPDQNRRILYVTIRTADDEWINPDDSVIIDGAGGLEIPMLLDLPAIITSPGNMLMTNGIGHDAMLSDDDTMESVKRILDLKDAGMPIR